MLAKLPPISGFTIRHLLKWVAVLFVCSQTVYANELLTLEDDEIDRQPANKAMNAPAEAYIPLPRQKQLIQITPVSATTPPKPRRKENTSSPVAAEKINLTSIPLPKTRPTGIELPPPPFATGLISNTDRAHYKRAFEHLSRFQWKSAIADAEKATYQLPAKYIYWRWLRLIKVGPVLNRLQIL